MDLEPFLTSLEGDAASGVDLRNEPAFHEIERKMSSASRDARRGKDGTYSVTTNTNWGEILADATELAASGRDLRLLVIVTRALFNTEGVAGLAAGLDMLSDSLEAYWDSIHPELRDRPDPAVASLRRKSALMQIENDDEGVLCDLELNAVITPRGIGPIRGQELATAALSEYDYMLTVPRGLSGAEEEALKQGYAATVNRVTAGCRALVAESPEEAVALAEALAAADAARARLEETFNRQAGLKNGIGCRFPELESQLTRSRTTLARFVEDAGDAAGQGRAAEAAAPAQASDGGAAPTAPAVAPAKGGGIPMGVNSRKDVEKCLDMIIEFYERTEPSHPIPLLARRIRRMVPMDFMQLMEEIAPSGIKEFKSVAGVGDKGK